MTRVVFRDAILGMMVLVGHKLQWSDVSPSGVTPDESWLTLDGKRIARLEHGKHGRMTIIDERNRQWHALSIESVDPVSLDGSCAAPHCDDDAEDGHFLCLTHGRMAE